MTGEHIPVLAPEMVAALCPGAGLLYLDGTFGGGGWTQALLEAAPCRVVALDRDPAAISIGHELASTFAGRLTVLEGCFGEMESLRYGPWGSRR